MIRKLAAFMGDPGYVKQRHRLLYASLALVAIIDLFIPRHHGFFWEYWPGFSALYGLISCVLIIVVSKFLGHQGGLMKREDFYHD